MQPTWRRTRLQANPTQTWRGQAARWPEWLFGCLAVWLFGCLAVWLLAAQLPPPCWLRLRRGGCGVARASERACFVN